MFLLISLPTNIVWPGQRNRKPMYYDKKTRRLFLKNAAGLMLAIPVLPSLIEQLTNTAYAADPDDGVKAFIFARTYYGLYDSYRYIHDKTGWQTLQNTPLVKSKSLASIANHNVNTYLGTSLFDNGLEEYATLSLGNTSFHSCNHVQSPVLAACDTIKDTSNPTINQSSIDVLIEDHFRSTISSSLKSIRVRPGGKIGSHSQSYSFRYNQTTKSFTRAQFIDLPSVFHNTFMSSLPATNADLEKINRLKHEKKSAMDFILNEYNSVKNKVSYEDKLKLEEYADGINQISQNVMNEGKNSTCTKPSPPSPAEDKPGNVSEVYETMNTMIAQAIKCGLTKVVCIDLPHYKETGSAATPFHGNSHGGQSSKTDSNTDYHMKGIQFARDRIYDLALKLKGINDTDGKNLLEKSIIFHTSEMGWEHSADMGNAIMMLGKANGKINAGNIFDYRLRYSNGNLRYRINGNAVYFGAFGWSTYGSLLESFLQMAGIDRSSYLLKDQFVYGQQSRYLYNQSYAKQFHNASVLTGPPPFLLK